MGVFTRESVAQRNITAAFMSDLGPGMHPRISIRGGQFALIDASGGRYGANCMLKNTPQGQKLVMLAIIIGSNPKKSRVYYEHPFDPDNPAPPDCYSDNGIAPSVNAGSPQARTCAECTFSKWGSDTSDLSGKKTKACDEKKKIGVLVIGDTAQHVYELQVPPATLKNMATYGALIGGHNIPGANRKADLCDVVTEISFVQGSTGVLEFGPHCLIDCAYVAENGAITVARDAQGVPRLSSDEGESVGALMDEIWNSDELDEILGIKDVPFSPPAGFLAPGMSNYLEPQAHGGALQRGQALPAPAPAGVDARSPYVPPAGAAGTQPAILPVQAAAPGPQPAAAAQGPQPAAAPRRRGRPAGGGAGAQAAATPPAALAAPAAAPAPTDPLEVPAFLRRQQAAPAAPAQGTNGGGAAQSFGAGQAAPPPNAMEHALEQAFGLSTKR